MRILIVEDDRRLARLMARVLEDEHFTVDVAHDGDTGLELALRGAYAVAIVDWMLPGRDGPALCRAVRAARLPLALLLLTARGQIEDRVVGLDSGADDYLVKPFAFEELLARVRARPPIHDYRERRLRAALRRYRARPSRSHGAARRPRARSHIHRVEPTGVPDAPFWASPDPRANPRLRLVVRAGRSTFTRGCVYLVSAPQTAPPGQADPISTVRGIGYRLEMDGV